MKIPENIQENQRVFSQGRKKSREVGTSALRFVELTRDGCPDYILAAATQAAKNLLMEVDVNNKKQLKALSREKQLELINETKNVLDTNSEKMSSSANTDD